MRYGMRENCAESEMQAWYEDEMELKRRAGAFYM
jgi:hypothetical protein